MQVDVFAEMNASKGVSGIRGAMAGSASQNVVKFIIRAAPMPITLLDYLLDNLSVFRRLLRDRNMVDKDGISTKAAQVDEEEEQDVQADVERTPTVKPEHFWSTLEHKCVEAGGEWASIVDRIWSFGPQGAGGCILVDARSTQAHDSCVESSIMDSIVNARHQTPPTDAFREDWRYVRRAAYRCSRVR
jgi:ribosome assembly protein 1